MTGNYSDYKTKDVDQKTNIVTTTLVVTVRLGAKSKVSTRTIHLFPIIRILSVLVFLLIISATSCSGPAPIRFQCCLRWLHRAGNEWKKRTNRPTDVSVCSTLHQSQWGSWSGLLRGEVEAASEGENQRPVSLTKFSVCGRREFPRRRMGAIVICFLIQFSCCCCRLFRQIVIAIKRMPTLYVCSVQLIRQQWCCERMSRHMTS